MKRQLTKSKVARQVSLSKKGLAFVNYSKARSKVFSMLDRNYSLSPSKYWVEELSGFDYLFDASPLIVSQLRKHCYHLTGIRDYDYREHHSFRAKYFKEKLDFLKTKGKSKLFVPESPLLGGFGYTIGKQLVNIDTLKFYESLLALDNNNLLDFRSKKIVLEIGAGWGGFAYQFKTLFPKTSYIIVDLPASILFSATYLTTMFPKSRVFISDGDIKKMSEINIKDWDFVFIPNNIWKHLKFTPPDLVINMVSFQEMTDDQVEEYVKKCADWGCRYLYSLNRERSYYNPQITGVSKIISKYYQTEDISISSIDYNQLSVNPEKKLWVKVIGKSLGLLEKQRRLANHNRYRHIIGRH